MKTAYKIRWIPFSTMLIAFVILILLRFVAGFPISKRVLFWAGGLTFVAFIFLQAMRENENNKLLKAQEPQMTIAEIEVKERQDETTLLTGRNIPIVSVKLLFSLLLTLLFTTILKQNVWFGLSGIAIGLINIIVNLASLCKYVRRLRDLRDHDK